MTLRRILSFCLAALTFPAGPALAQQKLTKQDIDRWMKEMSNWGRWGKDDQLGAVNLITPAKRREAAALVRDGVSVSLSRDINKTKEIDNPSPFTHTMTWTGANTPGPFSLDVYSVSYHGYGHTHMDALCHMFYQGKMYNGYPQSSVTASGAEKMSIVTLKNGIISRGVLMDIPRLKGVPYLEPPMQIQPADLDAWEKMAGVKVGSGDIIFIRTGRWARRKAKGAWDVSTSSAGLSAWCIPWLKKRDVAIVGSDAATDASPSGIPGVEQPIHQLVLIAMGTPIFDNCDLEALSEAAAQRKRWTFMITAGPLAVPGGTGSPLNPIATF